MSAIPRVRGARSRIDNLRRRLAALEANVPDQSAREALLRIEHLVEQSVQGMHPRRYRGVDQAVQHALRLHYEDLIARGRPLPAFGDVEMRFYSQNGEDGILQLLLAAVGMDTKKTVEICAGDGTECNSANLIVNHGWTGLLVDGGDEILTKGRDFYENGADTWYWPPTLRQAWITRDTVNDLVTDAGFAGDIDVLTIDLDGVDYWIWQALECVNPRIVVTEYNAAWPPEKAMTVPYRDDFAWEKGTLYIGASLGALVKLAREKGYRLVGSNRYGFNAFFVRNDLAVDVLPEVDPATAFGHPGTQQSRAYLHTTEGQDWVEV